MHHDVSGISADECQFLINQWIIGFRAERNRAIMRDRLLLGLTYEQIAERHDMSTRHVKNICYACMEKISKHIK